MNGLDSSFEIKNTHNDGKPPKPKLPFKGNGAPRSPIIEKYDFPTALTPQNSKSVPSQSLKFDSGIKEVEEDPIVIGKELPQLKFDLFSSKFTPHPSYKYPVRNINNITDIPFPSQMVQLRKKISKNGPSNFKDGNYYLEIEYGNLISAVSQEMPFSNIPEESRKPWFKVLIYSGINKDGNPNKEK